MCTPWAWDSVVPASDRFGLGMFYGGAAVFQGLAPGSSPTSGTVFYLVSGLLAADCVQNLTCGPLRRVFCWWPCCGAVPPFFPAVVSHSFMVGPG